MGGNDHQHADRALEQAGGGGQRELARLKPDAVDVGVDDVDLVTNGVVGQVEDLVKAGIEKQADIEDEQRRYRRRVRRPALSSSASGGRTI